MPDRTGPLPRAMSRAVAADLLLTGREFSGTEAAQLGPASAALNPDEVLPTALQTAWDIAENCRPSLRVREEWHHVTEAERDTRASAEPRKSGGSDA